MDYKRQIEMKVDDAVTVYMRRSGISQADLSSLVGMSDVQFSRKRRGEAVWRLDELLKLCDIIGCKPADLVSI